MNLISEKSFTAFVGIDWADSKHDICIQAAVTLLSFYKKWSVAT